MIVSINQPAYLPWLGYFHRIALSDLHIVLDHVQFEKNSFVNRNKIRGKEGWSWLTVPLMTAGRFGALPIDELEIDGHSRWAEKHAAALRSNYSKAAYFGAHADFFEEIYRNRPAKLNPLMREITRYLSKALGIHTPILFSSEMKTRGEKDALVLNLCREAGADVYLSGPLGRNYLREEIFNEAGIKVLYHDYKHPVYSQAFPGFETAMAAIDLLFNHGSESLGILMSGNSSKERIAKELAV